MNQKIIDLVNDQWNKEALWVEAATGTEEMLQKALYDLHTAIENALPKSITKINCDDCGLPT